MTEWIASAQEEMRRLGLPGWLIYDFRGLNRIARDFLKLGPGMLTRRVFLYVPASGRPQLLVHAIEKGSLAADLPVTVRAYSSHQSLAAALREMLPAGKLAMEYSPGADIPYLSFVDAGTVELLRGLGVEPVSSADLLQVFSTWSAEQLEAHRTAAAHCIAAKDQAYAWISARLAAGEEVREAQVQDVVSGYFDAHGLEYDHAAIVGFAANASDPHYAPQHGSDRKLEPGDAILVDLWCKLPGADNPYADITWSGCWGEPDPEHARMFEVVATARDLGVKFIRDSVARGEYPRGCDVDDVVRGHIAAHGFGDWFSHRTGHSIGLDSTHGSAVHLDNFETHDSRRILPGVAVTIEPGIYLPRHGVRTEINLFMHEDGPEVTTDLQFELIRVGD